MTEQRIRVESGDRARRSPRAVVVAAVACVSASQYRSLLWAAQRVGVELLAFRIGLAVVSGVAIWRFGRFAADWPVPGGRHRYTSRSMFTAGALWWFCVAVLAGGVASRVVAVLTDTQSTAPRLADRADTGAVARDLVELVVAAPLIEECVYRLVLLGILIRVMPTRSAVVVQAVVFAIAHTDLSLLAVPSSPSGNGYGMAVAVDVAFAGLFHGFVTAEFGRLWPSVAFHAFGNLLVASGQINSWMTIAVAVPASTAVALAVLRGVTEPGPKSDTADASDRRLTPDVDRTTIAAPGFQRPLCWTSPRLAERLSAVQCRRAGDVDGERDSG